MQLNINYSSDTSDISIQTRTYRFLQIHKEGVDSQIKKLLEQKIIRPSTSPWNFAVWVVPRKQDASGQKKWRLVIDYRKLNDISIGDSHPLPNITDILDQLGHSKYVSTLDLASVFHQINIEPKDIPKTDFTVPSWHYEYVRMSFGLKTAPARFQRSMDCVHSGLQGTSCFVYLDDVNSDKLFNQILKLKSVFFLN